jgi:hypothetical protein
MKSERYKIGLGEIILFIIALIIIKKELIE